jgi:hypothetical protein
MITSCLAKYGFSLESAFPLLGEERDLADNKRILWDFDPDVLAGACATSFPCPLWRI